MTHAREKFSHAKGFPLDNS